MADDSTSTTDYERLVTVLTEHGYDPSNGWACLCGEKFGDRMDFSRPATARDQFTALIARHQAEHVEVYVAARVSDVVNAIEALLDDCDQFSDTLQKPNRVAIWGVRRVLMQFGGTPHRFPLPALDCAECGHRTSDHGIGSIHDHEECCRADDCDCLLSSDEAAWGHDESIDDTIRDVVWEEAVANGEPWALGGDDRA